MSARIVMGGLLAATLLAGCGDSDVREVRDWMAQVQHDTKPSVKPLPEPKEYYARPDGQPATALVMARPLE